MAAVFSERLWVGIALGIGFLLGVLNRIGKAREMVLYQLSQTATISDVIDKLSSPERQSRFGISGQGIVPHYRIEFTNPAGEVVVYGAVNGRNHKKLDLPQSTLANLLERERPTTNRIELEREFDVAGRDGYFAPPCYESDKAAGPTARLNF